MRTCLRKGCGRRFRPSRRNQAYCQDAGCLREVRRWRARKRQRRWRERAEVQARRRLAEKDRRARRRAAGERRVRGDAGRARCKGPICDRPGCFDPPARSVRTEGCYCGRDCRRVMRRVRDRERKWRLRLIKRRRAEARRRATGGRGTAPASRFRRERGGARAIPPGPPPPGAPPSSPIAPSTAAAYASLPEGRRSDGRDGVQTIGADRSETGEDAPDGGDAVRLDGRARPP